ncbi:MAG: GNAT family N-acetyltransferase [Dehalococcoidia bacterium]|nr:GNAT family N-acetyltransferase [Dehalococcoidia bacterium]
MLTTDGRIDGTSSQEPWLGPLFRLVRGKESCAWAVRVDVPQNIADELDGLAREEPPVSDFRDAPLHAERYMSLLRGEVDSGPAFTFPEELAQPSGTAFIEDIESLDHHFTGWTADEIPYRTPIVAVVEKGYAVSACFSAWRSDTAAEAGLETAPAFRGRGLGPQVTAGWAVAIRASGRVPLYSTSWSNDASLAVSRKLGLVAYASKWSIREG